MSTNRLQLHFTPYILELKHAFGLASNTRTSTPVVITLLAWGGFTGYGEASMPPYLGESHDSVMNFLAKVRIERFSDPFQTEDILKYVDGVAKANTAAKASVDIALHDLQGKIMGQAWHKIWGYTASAAPFTSFTLGIDTPAMIKVKLEEAGQFKLLKVKLGGGCDKQTIETIRRYTAVPLCVDVNQGWRNREQALEMIHWLAERNVVFVEQPMPKDRRDDMAWLTERSPLPTIADESVQRLTDVQGLHKVFSGINIKLMKCTGMREAHRMLELAKTLGMQVMIGCMTETSCAISAAAQLSPAADWADLDGALLIKNDLFTGVKVVGGKLILPNEPGISAIQNGEQRTLLDIFRTY